ncbi:MAG: hypothetical protein AAB922_03195 [Patescibacteria group bacterium]
MAYKNLLANATTTLKSSAGILNRIVINNVGAAGNILTIYDNSAASGTLVGVVDTVELNGRVLDYRLALNTGLTVVMGTGTAADITVVFDEENSR